MEKFNDLYRELKHKKQKVEEELAAEEKKLKGLSEYNKSIIIKKIRNKLYYYTQWRENGKVKSQFIAPVSPGAAAEEEKKILAIDQTKSTIKELQIIINNLDKMLVCMKKQSKKEHLMETFAFEVYWKDEITARVYVRAKEVVISRFTDNPLKQLFAASKMTRYQLGMILELRCWERGRPDIKEKLDYLGISEYNPYEIVRKTHGVSYNDYIWFRFPGEKLTGKDVLVR